MTSRATRPFSWRAGAIGKAALQRSLTFVPKGLSGRMKAMGTHGTLKMVVIAIVAMMYLFNLPHTVQDLDTGELVAGAYNLNVVHPPGYPTYVWLQHAMTHMIPIHSVFWRASLTSCLSAVAVLAGLTFATSLPWLGCLGLVLPLALHKVFWRYALLPDVFMLHCVFLAALMISYLYVKPSFRRTLFLAGLWAIGLGNHQTLLFAAPFVVHGIWEGCSRRRAFAAVIAAGGLCLCLYLSLFAMHPSAPASWGNLDSGGHWLRHVLRAEYGTFRLARATSSSGLSNLAYLLMAALRTMPLACVVALALPVYYALRRPEKVQLGLRYWILFWTTVVSTALFCLAANISPGAVFDRFLLGPFVSLTTLAVYAAPSLLTQRTHKVAAWAAVVGAVVLSGSQLLADSNDVNLSQDTVVEDYGQNLLRMAALTPRAVLLVEGDTPLNAMRYVQNVQGFHPEIPTVSTATMPTWRVEKLAQQAPWLRLPEEGGIEQANLMRDLVVPNQPASTFIVNTAKSIDLTGQHVTFLGLGKRLSKGSGQDVAEESIDAITIRFSPEDFPGDPFKEEKVMFASYALADLMAASLASDHAQKRKHFARALERVSYCWPAAYELCRLDGQREGQCRNEAVQYAKAHADYFH